MLVKIFGSAVFGVDAMTISIEVNVMSGRDYYIVGLPDNAVRESIQRVESAIRNNGYVMPRTKVVINLSPAGIKKSGPAFDLPIAIALLAATEQIEFPERLAQYTVMGELNLDGSVLPVKGVLSMAVTAAREKFGGLIIPQANGREAALVSQLPVYGISHLKQLVEFFKNPELIKPTPSETALLFDQSLPAGGMDFSDVKGQENVKRALEIAAAGGHNLVLIGPPGSGKTMLAKRLPTILPPLSLEEALETTRIYSVAGKLPADSILIGQRPFRSVHHSASESGLTGGGSIPQPGEISLAHHGVLFLDELPEFKRSVLEMLRQPLEEGKITLTRARMSVEFPSVIMLIASMNPCPCGYFNHPEKSCICPPGTVQKYLNKISGPLLDRIDLHVEVAPPAFSDLTRSARGEASADIRHRVLGARERQHRRYAGHPGIFHNALLPPPLISRFCPADQTGIRLLKTAMEKLHLSARAFDRILKVARTIADLDQKDNILPVHLAEAIQYRSLDREGWTGG